MKHKKIIIFVPSIFLLIGIGISMLISNIANNTNSVNNTTNYIEVKNIFDSIIVDNNDIKTYIGYNLNDNYVNYLNLYKSFIKELGLKKDIGTLNIEQNDKKYMIELFSIFNCGNNYIRALIEYKNNICSYEIYYHVYVPDLNNKDDEYILFSEDNLLLSSDILLKDNKYNISYSLNDKLVNNIDNILDKKINSFKEKTFKTNILKKSMESNINMLSYF